VQQNKLVKLNIGSGNRPFSGAINIDLYSDRADIRADARYLPFPDNSVDTLESHHLIEHLNYGDACQALQEWHRVLKPKGKIMVSCPDMKRVILHLVEKEFWNVPILWHGYMIKIYGSDEPGMRHVNGFCSQYLSVMLIDAGFKDVYTITDDTRRPTPSLYGIGEKGDAE